MGLDIYLKRYENREDTERLVTEYEIKSESNWNALGITYENLSDTQKQSIRNQNEKMAIEMGLDKNGSDPRVSSVEFNSTKYLEHHFKIGYFRSSYNGSGINRILNNLGLPDLYNIFNRGENDGYCFAPDWELVKVRANDTLFQLKSKPNYRCFTVSGNELSNKSSVFSEQDAITETIDQLSKYSDHDGYSNRLGYFYPKGLKIFAILPGKRKRLFSESLMDVSYVVMEGDNEWYCQALEIIIETCDFVLSREDKDKYFLHWSS